MTLQNLLRTVLRLLLRTLLVLMGAVFVLSLLAVALVLLMLWSLRALWARLTGRPVQPLVITLLRGAPWQRFYGAGQAQPARAEDVIDVEARPVSSGAPDRLGS